MGISLQTVTQVSPITCKSLALETLMNGGQTEIFTFAYMCQTDIYVFDVENNHWTAYTKTFIVGEIDNTSQSMYIYHPTDHFDVVCSVTRS